MEMFWGILLCCADQFVTAAWHIRTGQRYWLAAMSREIEGSDGGGQGDDRLPPISDAGLSSAQRSAVTALVNGPRGGLGGPFIPMLRSPEFMNRAQLLGEYLRYDSRVPPRLREMAILICARFWRQTYEWHVHAPLALKAGLGQDLVDCLSECRQPESLDDEQEAVYKFCNELHHDHCVSDETYARTVRLLGETGVVDLCGICGYYTMLAMVMNVARTPVPGEPVLPFPGPE